MATKEQVRALLERYARGMEERDRDLWVGCFAEDAVQEDPVGTTPNVGHEAIGRFFDGQTIPVTMTISQDPLVVGNEAIVFFSVVADIDGTKVTNSRVVDHIVLTEDGTRFQSLRAFFDPDDMRPIS